MEHQKKKEHSKSTKYDMSTKYGKSPNNGHQQICLQNMARKLTKIRYMYISKISHVTKI